jgi:hypothetical protein
MNETSRAVLAALRSDRKVSWVAEQLVTSFSEGVTLSARESRDAGDDLMALTPREKTKRQKHGTSRPYYESEKIELIHFALREIFIALPSMQIASIKALREFGSLASSIEFATPDEEERSEESYTWSLVEDLPSVEDLQRKLQEFSQSLVP